MKRLIKPFIFVAALLCIFYLISKYSADLSALAQEVWQLDDVTLDKVNKWTGILADGGTVLAVVVGLIWTFMVWPWKNTAPKPDRKLLLEYKRYIQESYKYLDFKGIEKVTEAVKNSSGLTLESVYVPLRARLDLPSGETWYRVGGRFICGVKGHLTEAISEEVEKAAEQAEQEAIAIEQWLEKQAALVILGDPGSGKSTSLKHIALSLLETHPDVLPILLPLNAYSAELTKRSISVEEFLPVYFHSKRAQLTEAGLASLIHAALTHEKAFVLLDGLDEVGSNRGQVVQQVEQFVRTWLPDPEDGRKTNNRIIVTSRFVGYRDFPLADPRWQTVAINDWNLSEIQQFYQKFTFAAELAWAGGDAHATARQKAESEYQALLTVVGDSNKQGIRRLAGNPLLSSLLALIKRQGVNLPDRRVKLYELYMDTLLRSWNRSRNLDGQPIGVIEEDAAVYSLLAKLALHVRETNPQQGLIAEDAMQAYLRAHYQGENYSREAADYKAQAFLKSVHEHSNLLIERGYQQYGFIHLTFEEYLAGFALAKQDASTLRTLIPIYLQNPKQWKETLLLAMGVIAVLKTEQEKINAILDALLITPEAVQVLFVGEVLMDVGASQLGNRMSSNIKQQLISLMQNPQVDIQQRAQAGRILSEVGDPRPGVTIKTQNGEPLYYQRGSKRHTLPDIDWVKLPAGMFRMGSEQDDAEAYNNEKPAHTVTLDEFYISRYPITNAQYRCFVEAGMYEDEAFWRDELAEAAWRWWQGEVDEPAIASLKNTDYQKVYRDWLSPDKNRRQPRFWQDKEWNLANHPVVGVSCWEVLAYCLWLNTQLNALLPALAVAGLKIRLVTEAEWEYAVRGKDNWRYAWGNESNPLLGNYADTGLGFTSPVGLFSAGKAWQAVDGSGLHDLSGNVWEWVQNRYKVAEQQTAFYVLRGGSWSTYGRRVRTAMRVRNLPINRGSDVGFRLVLGQ